MKLTAPKIADYALLTLLAAIWGSSFMLIKIAVETIPALPMTTARLVVAATVMLVFALASGQKLPRGVKLWTMMALAAIFGNALPFTLISWGEESVDSGLAAIMMAIMPLTTLFLAHIFTDDEKLNRWKFLGVMLGIVGLVVLIGPQKLFFLGHDVSRELAIAAAAVCYGISTMVVRFIKGVPARAMTTGILLTSVLVMVPVTLIIVDFGEISPSTASITATVSLGILQTAIANLVAFFIIQKLGATFFSQLNFLVPLFGVLFGVVFLAETPSLNALFALIIIFTGVGVARYGIYRSLR